MRTTARTTTRSSVGGLALLATLGLAGAVFIGPALAGARG
jgi:hypothetical protein